MACLERRHIRRDVVVVDRLAARTPRGATHLVADAVDEHLPHVGAQRTVAAVLEPVQMGKRLEQRILHHIRRVDDAADLPRQAAAGEPAEFGTETREESLERLVVASSGARQQPDRRRDRRRGGSAPAR